MLAHFVVIFRPLFVVAYRITWYVWCTWYSIYGFASRCVVWSFDRVSFSKSRCPRLLRTIHIVVDCVIWYIFSLFVRNLFLIFFEKNYFDFKMPIDMKTQFSPLLSFIPIRYVFRSCAQHNIIIYKNLQKSTIFLIFPAGATFKF